MPSFVLKNFVVRETLSPYQTWAWKAYLLRQLTLGASSYPSSPEEVISPKANLEKRETGCWIKSSLCFDDNASSLNYFSCNPLFYGGNKQTNMTRSISWETAIGLLCHSRKTKTRLLPIWLYPFCFLVISWVFFLLAFLNYVSWNNTVTKNLCLKFCFLESLSKDVNPQDVFRETDKVSKQWPVDESDFRKI